MVVALALVVAKDTCILRCARNTTSLLCMLCMYSWYYS